MIIDAYATDTTPSHEVRRRALEALASTGEPMSEVTYDALRKRLATAEAEITKLRAALAIPRQALEIFEQLARRMVPEEYAKGYREACNHIMQDTFEMLGETP